MAVAQELTIEEFMSDYEQVRTPDFARIAECVNYAKGPERNMAQFADATGIGASTLSRIVNQISSKPLSKEIIVKIYEARANKDAVMLLDSLARANGMFPKDYAERVRSDDQFAARRNEMINRERMMKNSLIGGVVACGMPVKQVVNTPLLCKDSQLPLLFPRRRGDFILDLDSESNTSSVKNWTFFLYPHYTHCDNEEGYRRNAKRDASRTLESISPWLLLDAWMPEALDASKFSFVFLDLFVFEEFVNAMQHAKLHTEMTAILLDVDNYSVVKEVWLPGSYNQLSNISIFEVPAPLVDEHDNRYDEEDDE